MNQKEIKGFTLVEVMIATVIFAFVGMGLIALMMYVRRLAENNVYQAMAQTISQGYVEQLKSMAWFDLLERDGDGHWVPRDPVYTVSGIDGDESAPLEFYIRQPINEDGDPVWPTNGDGDPDPFVPFDYSVLDGLSGQALEDTIRKIAQDTGRNVRQYKVVAETDSDGTDGEVASGGRMMRMVFTPEIQPLTNHENHGLLIHLHVLYEVPSTTRAMHQSRFTVSAIRTRYNSF